MKRQIRFYIEEENLQYIEDNKNEKNLSDFLNKIIKSYMELNNDTKLQISPQPHENTEIK